MRTVQPGSHRRSLVLPGAAARGEGFVKLIEKLRHHLPRIRHALGKPLVLRSGEYRLRGYHPDRLARAIDDEPHMIPVLERVFKEHPGAILDVGANCGQTLLKVLAVDPRRVYFGFEPQVECCFFIENFLRANALRNANIIPVALSDTDGMIKLFWDRPTDLTASLLPTHADSPTEQRPHSSWVPARRGDELVRELGVADIAAIKIDVEGFELEVLTGLKETLRERKPVILFEVLTNYFWHELLRDEPTRRLKQARADAIFSLLSSLDYRIYRIDGAGAEHRIDRFELDQAPDFPFVNDGRDYLARCGSS